MLKLVKKNVFSKLKNLDYRHLICGVITLLFVSMAVFEYQGALGRLVESGRDFGLTIAYYFFEMFDLEHNITPTITTFPKIPYFSTYGGNLVSPDVAIADNWSQFKLDFVEYWQAFASKENILEYLLFVARLTLNISMIVLTFSPSVLILVILSFNNNGKKNNDYNRDTYPLILAKVFATYVVLPLKNAVVTFIDFVKSHKVYYVIWGIIWAYSFNFITIILEVIAFYFYFIVSFDVVGIYTQVYKLFFDLSSVFSTLPWLLWVVLGFWLFDRFRKKIGYERLNHMERMNRGFINERPIVYMICGTMGKKKTTTLTDMALSQEVMFRDKALEKILENDLRFPHFPWINLENDLREQMEYHKVYNLATVKLYVQYKAEVWFKDKTRENIFDYDFNRYGVVGNDSLRIYTVWEIIETYAQLYFIYIIQSSLLISNYSVRVDSVLSDLGNFPLWNSDFFKRDSRLMEAYSRHSHILDFDSLRLGKKIIDKNANADSFEFGVVLITEVGKERGNAVENKEKKATDKVANQKNDNFNVWLKMVRHSATVDNFPFVRVICDEQRPESLGADARELCDIVYIRESGEFRLAMPFFYLEDLVYEWARAKFTKWYVQYRYVRSDNTLFGALIKSLYGKLFMFYKRTYNTFSYCVERIQIESGTQDGDILEKKYYITSKKDYSDRFATDCFSDFFQVKALRSVVGLDDIAEYESRKASFEEMIMQNSYFSNGLISGFGIELKEEKEVS